MNKKVKEADVLRSVGSMAVGVAAMTTSLRYEGLQLKAWSFLKDVQCFYHFFHLQAVAGAITRKYIHVRHMLAERFQHHLYQLNSEKQRSKVRVGN